MKRANVSAPTNVPPLKKKESNFITMTILAWRSNQTEQLSPVYRIGGFPWRLRVHSCDGRHFKCFLVCEKSKESELWECNAAASCRVVQVNPGQDLAHTSAFGLASWRPHPHEVQLCYRALFFGDRFDVEVVVKNCENKLRPILDPLDARDGILVIGQEKKKIHVNKETLASQSPFFDRLFNGDFKEKNMAEIPIGDVGYEEFANIIKMVYGFEGTSLTGWNVRRVMELADRFELKIIQDRAISFILSPYSHLALQQKLLISDQYNIPLIMNHLLNDATAFSSQNIKSLCASPEWDQLSKETIRVVLQKISDRVH